MLISKRKKLKLRTSENIIINLRKIHKLFFTFITNLMNNFNITVKKYNFLFINNL